MGAVDGQLGFSPVAVICDGGVWTDGFVIVQARCLVELVRMAWMG